MRAALLSPRAGSAGFRRTERFPLLFGGLQCFEVVVASTLVRVRFQSHPFVRFGKILLRSVSVN